VNCFREISLTILFALLAAWALYHSMDWPLGTRLFPWLVAIPVVALCFIQLITDLAAPPTPNPAPTELQVENGLERERLTRVVTIICWIVGFAVAIWLLGFKVAMVLMIFGYLKFRSGESWRLSLALTAGGYAFFWGIFDHVLHITLPESQLAVWSEKWMQ
jgi:hypothetical protein